MRTHTWIIPVLLLDTMAYAVAEEMTLTTYYPSPRGVYSELRTSGNVQIGSIDPPADSTTTAPRLHLQQTDSLSTAPLLKIESNHAGATPVVIDKDGNVGIGTAQPDVSALLDLSWTTKGLRLPSMTQAQRDAIRQPALGRGRIPHVPPGRLRSRI